MKITAIEQFFPRKRTRLVKITTDEGFIGWGETTLEGRPASTCAAVDEMATYLVGKDPLRIEHHWQHIYRSSFFRGGPVVMSALSGIDQALWDIAGKAYGVPSYRLMGGQVRDRIRVYAHWGIHDLSAEGLARSRERLERLQTMGYTAYKGGPGGFWRAHEPPAAIDDFVQTCLSDARMGRAGCGALLRLPRQDDARIGHRGLQRAQGHAPMFVEEPVPQENVDAMKLVSDHVSFPIATGERLLTRWGFREIFEKHAVSLIQPDGSHVGGISELKKVANMAEVYYMHIMPHCAIGPVAFAACMQVDAVVPNFLIQEQVDACLGDGLLQEDWQVKDGFIELPTKPGLGFEIDEDAVQHSVEYAEELGGEFFYPSDGSVADW